MNFVHLHVHDCYSLLDGLGIPKKFLMAAKALGQTALAETNHGTCGGFFDFYKEATKQGVKPILGVEVYIVDDYKLKEKQKMYHLVLLAKNAEGVKNLYRIVTEANLTGFYYKPRISIDFVLEHCQDLIALSACASSYVSSPYLEGNSGETFHRCEVLQHHFKENFFLEIMPHNFPEQKKVNAINMELSDKYGIKLVATNDAHYFSQAVEKAHDVLLLVQSDSTNSNKKFVFDAKGLYLKSRQEMFDAFKGHEYLNEHQLNIALDNTLLVAGMIDIKMDYSKPIFPKIEIPAEFVDNYDYIKALIRKGLRIRGIKDLQTTNPDLWSKYVARLDYELGVIKDKGFIDYFLIVRDFIVWAKNNGIIVGPARGCFLPGNVVKKKILNHGGNHFRKIENVKNGDMVLTYDCNYQKVLNKFEYDVINQKCNKILLSNGKTITCTDDHEILTSGGWRKARNLTVLDVVYKPLSKITTSCRECNKIQKVPVWRIKLENIIKKSGEYLCTRCWNILYAKTPEGLKQRRTDGEKNKNTKSRLKNSNSLKKLFKETNLTQKELNIQNDMLHEEINIISNEQFVYTGKVYDIEVESAHNYTVGDIVVHNSAAGSLISYLLNISQLDPLEYNLLFERFLNPIRIKTPDIDTDFEAGRREEVKQYIINKYGQDKVASLGAFSYMSCKLAFKDVARVYELDPSWANNITKQMDSYVVKGSKEYMTLEENIANIPEINTAYQSGLMNKEVFDIACQLQLQPRHTTVTAAGLLITDKPITDYVSLKNAKGVMITEWDKYMIEEAKFLKMDVLGLKTLSVFRDCLKPIGKTIEWLFSLKLDDPKVYKLFRDGLTDGIFQFESDGIKSLLMQVKPTCFNDIVVANALYRPGAMKEIESYIKRKEGIEPITYDFPGIEDIVADTYGKVIFQEQVMLILSKTTGMSLAETDILRKQLESKDEEGKDKFIAKLRITNKDNPLLEQVISYIKNFGGYLFNKSHSCAYGLLAYYTAYLKAYYPKDFFTALLNEYIEDKTIMNQYYNEVKRIVKVNTLDINRSKAKFTYDSEGLNIGFMSCKGIGEKAALVIEQNAPYDSYDNFNYKTDHTAVNKTVVDILIKLGAFDSIEDRGQLLNRFGYKAYDYEKFEDEILGYNRIHKLDAYWKFRDDGSFKRFNSVSVMTPKLTGQFLGEFVEVTVRKDKRGNDFAITTVYDGQSKCKGLIWSNVYGVFSQIIKKGNVVVFIGEKSSTDNSLFLSNIEKIDVLFSQ